MEVLIWLLLCTVVLLFAACTLLVASSHRLLYQGMRSAPTASVQRTRAARVAGHIRSAVMALTMVVFIGGIGHWMWKNGVKKQELAQKITALKNTYDSKAVLEAPDWAVATLLPDAALIAYGQDLIANTNDYFGDKGLLKPHSINGLNCQNCHLDAGSKPFGNNYFGVASTYPLLRARSGTYETIPKRVNDCFERSLNGQPLDTLGREMQAIVSYIKWLGIAVPKGEKPKGAGLVEVPLLDRPADPAKGAQVYTAKCASCHGPDGNGLPMPNSERFYPPLWGERSYNEAAGLFRLSRFAGYVKANMPFGANYQNPQLSDEEAWDVAAYVNSQPRPKHPFLDKDFPDIAKKPFDHPFGPFADTFPLAQHKYGPFKPIVDFYKKKSK